MTKRPTQPDGDPASPDPATAASAEPALLAIVPLRERHDGWTAQRQVAFIQALAETASVSAACRTVGLSRASAYALYHRSDAQSFRQAWEIAIGQGMRRVADAALDRAINGVVQPIFYGGQQVGERRVFNDRLAMWMLGRHAPERFGAWREREITVRANPDGGAVLLTQALDRVIRDGISMQGEQPIPRREPLRTITVGGTDDEERDDNGPFSPAARQAVAQLEAENDRLRRELDRGGRGA